MFLASLIPTYLHGDDTPMNGILTSILKLPRPRWLMLKRVGVTTARLYQQDYE